MNRKEFFSISGVAVAAHTPETKKIWESWAKNKSDEGRKAIVKFAQDLGFEYEAYTDTLAIDAFRFLISEHPSINGVKSFILRKAIIDYS